MLASEERHRSSTRTDITSCLGRVLEVEQRRSRICAEERKALSCGGAGQVEKVVASGIPGTPRDAGDRLRRLLALRLLGHRGFFDQTSKNGIRGCASADAGSAGTRSLDGKLPSKAFGDLPLFFGIPPLDRSDPLVTFSVDAPRPASLCLIGESEVEADGGETAQSAHYTFTFSSVVADKRLKGSGVDCSIRHGGSVGPRRQPKALSV